MNDIPMNPHGQHGGGAGGPNAVGGGVLGAAHGDKKKKVFIIVAIAAAAAVVIALAVALPLTLITDDNGGIICPNVVLPNTSDTSVASLRSTTSLQLRQQRTLDPTAFASAAIPGSLSVTDSGTLNYNLPIELATGSNDMVPQVSLQYDSSQGNALAGQGWSLSGVPRVHRCPFTFYQDSKPNGFLYKPDDPLCIDGNRLLEINGAPSDPTALAEYRTEQESFGRILAYGTSSIEWFKVYDRNHRILLLGATSDSRVEIAPGIVSFWACNRIEDRFGNYFVVNYTNLTDVANAVVSEIHYTGNTVAQVEPYNSVKFFYTTRPDRQVTWLGGFETQLNQRLSRIEVWKRIELGSDPELFRSYNLSYSYSDHLGSSLLSNVTMCGSTSPNGTLCAHPTQFAYGRENSSAFFGFFVPKNKKLKKADDENVFVGDFNGDGISDIVRKVNDRMSIIQYSRENKMLLTVDDLKLDHSDDISKPKFLFGDWNGDGLTDMLRLKQKDMYHYFSTPHQNGSFAFSKPSKFNSLDYDFKTEVGRSRKRYYTIFTADFNGDGKTDIVHMSGKDSTAKYTVFLSQCTGTTVSWSKQASFSANREGFEDAYKTHWNAVQFGDFTGDGLDDFVLFRKNRWIFYITHIDANGNYNRSMWGKDTLETGSGEDKREFTAADVNGDGILDIVHWQKDGAYIWTLHGDTEVTASQNLFQFQFDSGYVAATKYSKDEKFWRQFIAVDINHDGKTDILHFQTPKTLNYWLSQGNGSFSFQGPLKCVDTYDFDKNKYSYVLGDFDGSGSVDLLHIRSRSTLRLFLDGLSPAETLLRHIDDGRKRVQIDYAPLTDSILHNRSIGSKFPVIDIASPMYVVKTLYSENGLQSASVDDWYKTHYFYSGAKLHRHGFGFLGFANVTKVEQTGDRTESLYYQETEYQGKPNRVVQLREERVLSPVNHLLLKRSQDYSIKYEPVVLKDGKVSFYHYIDKRQEEVWDLYNYNLATPITVTSSEIVAARSDFGFETFTRGVVVDEFGNYTSETVVRYIHRNDTWILGMGNSTVDTRSILIFEDGQWLMESRTTTAQFNETLGVALQSTVEPKVPNLRVNTFRKYDAFGNVVEESVVAPSLPLAEQERKVMKEFDASGRFMVREWNALGHEVRTNYSSLEESPSSTKDANGHVTYFEYDTLGRKLKVVSPDGKETEMMYDWCIGCSGVPLSIYKETTRSNYNDEAIVYFDALGRKIFSESKSLNGTRIAQMQEYDEDLRLKRSSRPFFKANGPQYWTVQTYDELGRVIQTNFPDSGVAYVEYQGLRTKTINQLQQETLRAKSSLGKLQYVIDALGYNISYRYTAFGDLRKIVDAGGVETIREFDMRGRLISHYDPNRGMVNYTLNPFGELVTQLRSSGRSTTYAYDLLGRVVIQSNSDEVVGFTYDTNPNGTGLLAFVNSTTGYREDYTYDFLSRPQRVQYTVDAETFEFASTFDSIGRVINQTFPSGYCVANQYSQDAGILYQLQECQSGKVLWELQEIDSNGSPKLELYGNGLQTTTLYDPVGRIVGIQTPGAQDLQVGFDYLGNVKSVLDRHHSAGEIFEYDPLNRLVNSSWYAGNNTEQVLSEVAFEYDCSGNVLWKSDVGNYTYDPVRPHAVSAILGSSMNRHYLYDADGNVIGDGTRNMTYNQHGKPIEIQLHNEKVVEFQYSHAQARLKRVDLKPSALTTIYLQNYERTVSATETIHKHYINGVATVFVKGAVATEHYLHRDHLGSVVAITNSSGQVTEDRLYDAFGKHRDAPIPASEGYSSSWDTQTNGPLPAGNWTVYDVSASSAPSHWYVSNGDIIQGSNIGDRDCTTPSGTFAIATPTLGWKDYSFSLTFSSGDNDYIGVVFRFQDTQNFYRLQWSLADSCRRLVKVVNGVTTVLDGDNVPYVQDQSYRLDVSLMASYITVRLDNVTLYSVQDWELNNGGFGLWSASNDVNRFRNVIVTPVCSDCGSVPVGQLPTSYLPSTGDRPFPQGFTGHTEVVVIGLIHMGARMYDPETGRFISPDAVMQEIDFSQALNAYSYVMNAPTSMVDPSGNIALGKFFGRVGQALRALGKSINKSLKKNAIARQIGFLAINAFALSTGQLYLVPAYAAYTTKLEGGSEGDMFKAALISAAQMAAFHSVGDAFETGNKVTGLTKMGQFAAKHPITYRAAKSAAHGMVGGVGTAARGGKFVHGFISSAATEAFSPLIDNAIDSSSFTGQIAQVGASGLVGGGISRASGGTFLNGFINGALARAFNHFPHRMPPRSGMGKWPHHPIRVGGENIAVMGQGGLDDFAEFAATGVSVWYSVSENTKMFREDLSFLARQNNWPDEGGVLLVVYTSGPLPAGIGTRYEGIHVLGHYENLDVALDQNRYWQASKPTPSIGPSSGDGSGNREYVFRNYVFELPEEHKQLIWLTK